MSVFFNQDFKEYIELLDKHEVQYVLVGGMAVNIHGYRRSTGDMDIYVNATPENHNKLKKVHADFGMHMGDMGSLRNFTNPEKFDVFTFGVSPIQIDVMTACKGLVFEEVYNNSILYKIDEGVNVKVADYRALIAAKRASARIRDIADIEELGKTRHD